MPKDFITIDRASLYGDQLLQLKQQLRNAAHLAEYLRDTANHMVADPDYADLEGTSGFGCGVGNGQTVYNLLSSCVSQLGNADVQAMIERIGG